MNNAPTTVVYRGKMFEIVHWEGKPGITFEAAVRSPGVRLLIECDIETVRLSARDIFDKLVAGQVQEGRSADVLWRWLATNGLVKFSYV